MATSADEKKWNSIYTEVRTTLTTATADEKRKLRIATQKVNVGSYVRERNGAFDVQIRAFGKLKSVGTFPNKEDATLAYAITKMKLGPPKRKPGPIPGTKQDGIRRKQRMSNERNERRRRKQRMPNKRRRRRRRKQRMPNERRRRKQWISNEREEESNGSQTSGAQTQSRIDKERTTCSWSFLVGT